MRSIEKRVWSIFLLFENQGRNIFSPNFNLTFLQIYKLDWVALMIADPARDTSTTKHRRLGCQDRNLCCGGTAYLSGLENRHKFWTGGAILKSFQNLEGHKICVVKKIVIGFIILTVLSWRCHKVSWINDNSVYRVVPGFARVCLKRERALYQSFHNPHMMGYTYLYHQSYSTTDHWI